MSADDECENCHGPGSWHTESCAKYATLAADNARLREALRFYADPLTYVETVPAPGQCDGVIPVRVDRGGRARVALSEPATRDGGGV